VKKTREDTRPRVRYLNDEELMSLFASLERREERRRAERDNANRWCKERGYRIYPDLKKYAYTDHLKPMIILWLHTGMRRGEIFDLDWRNVDSSTRSIAVVGDTAKSGRTRHISMNRTCFDMLSSWRKQCTNSSGRVFQNAEGARFDNVKKFWACLLKQADISAFCWHDMRHHFASRLAMVGVDLNAIRELLVHSDYEMTFRYADLASAHKRKAIELLD